MNIVSKFTLFILLIFISTTRLKANDTLNIEKYLFSKHIKAEKTKEGVFYTVYTEGGGYYTESWGLCQNALYRQVVGRENF